MKKLFVLILTMCMVLTASVALGESVKVGTNAEFPPFEFIADDGSIQGFDIELISAILDLAGIEYTVESMEFDALPAALAAGQIDIAIAGMTISEEKGKSVLFSEPYFSATQKIIVLADSPIKTVEDIKAGMKIGVQLGTTGDIYVTDSMEGIVCERYSKALDAIMDMKNGRIDAVMVDSAPASVFADEIEGLLVLEEMLSDEQYGIAVKPGNADLMDKINAGLATLKENGGFDELYGKYFETIE